MNRREALCSIAAAAAAQATAGGDPPGVSTTNLRAKWLNVVADDFVVDVWRNGKPVPAAKRSLVLEIFGATVEKIDAPLEIGDWLVLHVVHNRLRWNGCKFFGLAGMIAEGEATIVSSDGREWCSVDDPSEAKRFIAERDYLKHRIPKVIQPEQRWGEGVPRMNDACGALWRGKPIWGEAPSTYLKLRVEY